MFSRKTEEEKAAEQRAEEARRQSEEQAQRAAAEAAEQQRKAEEFAATPVGRATAAKQAGQQVFQILIPLAELEGMSSSFGSAENQLRGVMKGSVLDEIEQVGWRLEHADTVFVETGATSSSRVLATGEGTVTRGTIYGLYVFRASTPAS